MVVFRSKQTGEIDQKFLGRKEGKLGREEEETVRNQEIKVQVHYPSFEGGWS